MVAVVNRSLYRVSESGRHCKEGGGRIGVFHRTLRDAERKRRMSRLGRRGWAATHLFLCVM
jgi:hypothetical protein